MATAKKKTAAAAAESAQEPLEPLEVSQPQETAETLQEAPEGAPGAVLGPEDPEELLGCMEDAPGEDDIQEGFVIDEYFVAVPRGLHLREEPSLDARVIVTLPYGAGVLVDMPCDTDAEWLPVHTGILNGWAMTQYLDRTPPEPWR